MQTANSEDATMTAIERKVARAAMRRLREGPGTLSELAASTGIAEGLLRPRLIEWCGEGRCVGRVLGVDAAGRNVVEYRLCEGWRPEAGSKFATPANDQEGVADAA